MATYSYYVGYSRTDDTGPGQFTAGGMTVNRERPIESLEDVREVQSLLREHYHDSSLIVQAFSRFGV